MAAGPVHGPEPEVGDSSRAATARDQDSDQDTDLDRTALLQKCQVYP